MMLSLSIAPPPEGARDDTRNTCKRQVVSRFTCASGQLDNGQKHGFRPKQRHVDHSVTSCDEGCPVCPKFSRKRHDLNVHFDRWPDGARQCSLRPKPVFVPGREQRRDAPITSLSPDACAHDVEQEWSQIGNKHVSGLAMHQEMILQGEDAYQSFQQTYQRTQ